MECLLPDSTIIKQDDEPEAAYLIIQGHASVYVTFTYTKFQKTKVKTVSISFLNMLILTQSNS